MVHENVSARGESDDLPRPVSSPVQSDVGEQTSPARTGGDGSQSGGSSPAVGRVPVVWVVNEGGHNYEPGKKWGRLIPLTTSNINHFNVDRLAVNIAERIRAADEEDFVLISGSPLLNVIVFQLWLRRFKKAKVLQHSVKSDDYVLRILHAHVLEKLATSEGRPA